MQTQKNYPMSNDGLGARFALGTIALLAAIFILIAWDMLQDYAEGTGGFHVLIESTVLILALGGIGLLLSRVYREQASARELRRDLSVVKQESNRWREDSRILIEGLGSAVQKQFVRWELSAAESEIALLLLKGFSLNDVAGMRGTSERTVREQARNVYRKAGISGRSGLSAFFLEDLLLPPQEKGSETLLSHLS